MEQKLNIYCKYKITYKLNGGKNAKKNPTAYTYKTSTIKLKNPTRKGYVFKGWYLDKKFKKKVTVINKGSSGNKTLYAKWKKKYLCPTRGSAHLKGYHNAFS